MIGLLITGLIALFLIGAAFAPLESLGWWAGWFGEKKAPPFDPNVVVDPAAANIPPAQHYMVYLSGIGAITDDDIPQEEIKWLGVLNQRIVGTELITDVFPYSVTNSGLTNKRMFSWLWRKIDDMRLKDPMAVSALLVNLRNVLQVAVSADPRYGPIYNYGVAQEIVRALRSHGYPLNSGIPVTMLGWSGGGQISLGTSTFLKGMLEAPIRLISIGGVMADDPGLNYIERLDHYYGGKDPVQGLGGKAYFGRWPIAVASAWNKALAAGKITMTELGPIAHMGKGNYFDFEVKNDEGLSFAELTLRAVTGSLIKFGVLAPEAAALGEARTDAPVAALTETLVPSTPHASSSSSSSSSPLPNSLPMNSEVKSE